MKKKILIISPMNLPVPAVNGGAVETLIESLIKENEKKDNVDLYVASCFNQDAFEISKRYKSTFFLYFKLSRFISFLDNLINFFINITLRPSVNKNYLRKYFSNIYVKRLLLKNDFDKVVFENSGFLTKLYNGKIKKKYKGKIYYHVHNSISNNSNKELLLNENIITVSDFLIREGKKRFGDEYLNHSYLLKNGINVSNKNLLTINEKNEFRSKLGFSNEDIIVCFVGRISREKGVLELLNAIEMTKNKNIKLLLIGASEFKNSKKSEYFNIISNKIKTMSKYVKMTGFISNDQLWKYYQSSDIAVFPSVCEEAAGLTILEALFNGRYVITTNSGGIPEYFNSDFGLMLNNDSNLVNSLTLAIDEKLKTRNIGHFNNTSREYVVSNYSEEIFYNNFIKIMNVE